MSTTIAKPRVGVRHSRAVEELSILPLRDGTLFPRAALPLTIGRPAHVALVLGLGEDQRIGIIGQRDPEPERPRPSDLYEIGTIGLIHKILRLANEHVFVFCEGIARFRMVEFTATEPDLKAKVELIEEMEPPLTPELEALRDEVVETFKRIVAANVKKLASLVRGRENFARLVSALIRVQLKHKYDEILAAARS